MNYFGEWLKEQRNGKDAGRFANKIGVSKRSLYMYESGDRLPSEEKLEDILLRMNITRQEKQTVEYWADVQRNTPKKHPEVVTHGRRGAEGKLGKTNYELIYQIEKQFGSLADCPEDNELLIELQNRTKGVA